MADNPLSRGTFDAVPDLPVTSRPEQALLAVDNLLQGTRLRADLECIYRIIKFFAAEQALVAPFKILGK